jgi:hypothetical protein
VPYYYLIAFEFWWWLRTGQKSATFFLRRRARLYRGEKSGPFLAQCANTKNQHLIVNKSTLLLSITPVARIRSRKSRVSHFNFPANLYSSKKKLIGIDFGFDARANLGPVFSSILAPTYWPKASVSLAGHCRASGRFHFTTTDRDRRVLLSSYRHIEATYEQSRDLSF